MTDRISKLTVVLVEPQREEDIQDLILAIRMLRGVAGTVHSPANLHEEFYAELRVKQRIQAKLYDAIAESFLSEEPHKT